MKLKSVHMSSYKQAFQKDLFPKDLELKILKKDNERSLFLLSDSGHLAIE